jgi:hypothetical protein
MYLQKVISKNYGEKLFIVGVFNVTVEKCRLRIR